MATPTKTTAAKTAQTTAPAAPVKTETEASKASRTAPLDLSFLTSVKPVEVAAPVRAPGAGRKAGDNSLVEGWLQDSWDSRKDGETIGAGRGLPNVPLNAVGALKSKFNKAAAKLKLGVSFAVDEDKAAGTATLRYVAKTRKNTSKTGS